MNFSASELVKRSASQLVYIYIKRIEYEATPRQYRGNIHAEKIIELEEASAERRGVINIEKDLLFFCVDMVKGNTYVEIKMVEGEYEQWYLESSIVQSAFYASLLEDVKTLDTPKFRKKEGYKQKVDIVEESKKFELWFGEDRYDIVPSDKLKQHFIEKLIIVKRGVESRNFDEARIWDAKFKFKEYDMYKPKYKLIKIK